MICSIKMVKSYRTQVADLDKSCRDYIYTQAHAHTRARVDERVTYIIQLGISWDKDSRRQQNVKSINGCLAACSRVTDWILFFFPFLRVENYFYIIIIITLSHGFDCTSADATQIWGHIYIYLLSSRGVKIETIVAKIGIYIIITPTSHMVFTARRQQEMHATEIGEHMYY
jgi:hypothetical protein